MRTISAAQSTILAGTSRSEWLRVLVKDGGGTWRDLSSWPGFDSVTSASWGESLDQPHATAEVTLKAWSGPVTVQPLTNAGVALGVPQLNQEIRIAVALMAALTTPSAGDWFDVFRGHIWQLDCSSADNVILRARDLGGRLQDLWMEKEHIHGLATVTGVAVPVRIFDQNVSFIANEYVIPSDSRRDGAPYFYKVTTGGTTAAGDAAEPNWGGSGTFTSGGVTFTFQGSVTLTGVPMEQMLQSILDANNSGVTLYTPTSPSATLKALQVQRGALLEQLRQIAMSIGWDVRYKWDNGTAAHRLTLYEPQRTSPSSLRTFGVNDYKSIEGLTLDLSNVRTGGECYYSDPADPWPDRAHTPKRKSAKQSNPTAEAKYGRRWAELGESSTSPIDTLAEAQRLIDAFVADCSEPGVVATYQFVHGFPFVELNDYYTFTADVWHYTGDLSAAVFEYRHQAQNGFLQTSIGVRGYPSAGFNRWEQLTGRVFPEDIHRGTRFQSARGPTLATADVVGGTKVSVSESLERFAFEPEHEIHIGNSSSFTPSNSTIVGVTKSDLVVPDLTPGALFYVKSVPRMRNGARLARGLPSAAVAFTAGRAAAGHLTSQVDWGRQPLNGGFESRFNPTLMPDHWTSANYPDAGGLAPAVIPVEDAATALAGLRYLKFLIRQSGDVADAESDTFDVCAGQKYRLSFWRKNVTAPGASGSVYALIYFMDSTGAGIGGSFEASAAFNNNVGTWVLTQGVFTAPSNARTATIRIGLKISSANREAWIDSVTVEKYDVGAQETWIAPTLLNSWVNYASGWETAGYYKDSLGIVHVRGLVRSGTVGSPILNLPAGYRPALGIHFATVASAGANEYGALQVSSAGDVTLATGFGNSWVSINCSFLAEL